MTPNLPPVLPGFSEPVMGPLKIQARDSGEYNDIASSEIGHEEWVLGWWGSISSWYSLRLGSAIARANGIGGEEIPDNLPPYPPVHEGYDRWEYRGKSIKDITVPYLYAYPDGEEWITSEGWPGQEYGFVHYIEAVKEPTASPCESESPKPEEGLFSGDPSEWDAHDDSNAETTPPKPEGETPRTDAQVTLRAIGREVVPADFARQLESDLSAARADSDGWRTKFLTQRDEANSNTWIWMGDGEDHPESLTCPVIMSADQLREFVAAKEREQRLRAALEAYEKWEGAVSRSRPDDSNAVQNGRVELLQIAKDLRDKALAPASSGKGEG